MGEKKNNTVNTNDTSMGSITTTPIIRYYVNEHGITILQTKIFDYGEYKYVWVDVPTVYHDKNYSLKDGDIEPEEYDLKTLKALYNYAILMSDGSASTFLFKRIQETIQQLENE